MKKLELLKEIKRYHYLSSGYKDPLRTQAEADELLELHKKYGPGWGDPLKFVLAQLDKAEKTLEFYKDIHNFRKNVQPNEEEGEWQGSLEEFDDEMDVQEIYGPNSTGDFGIKAYGYFEDQEVEDV